MGEVSGHSILDKLHKSSRIYDNGNKLIMKSEKMCGVKFAFGWNRFNLRMIGLWPNQTWKQSQASLITIYRPLMWNMLIFSFVVVPPSLALIAYPFPLNELITGMSAVAGFIAVTIKILIVWCHRDDFVRCLWFVTEDWTQELSARERETMIKNARLSRNISIGVTILVHTAVWLYVLIKAWDLLNLNFDAYNSTDLGKQLFFPAYWPFDLGNPSNFAFAWSGQCVSILCAAFPSAGTDGFIAMLVIHVCGQLTILRHSLANLIDDDTFQSSKTFRIQFRSVLKRHNALIRLTKLIEDALSLLLLLLILVHTFQLCCQLFGLMTAVVERKPGRFPFVQVFYYLTFLNVVFGNIFVYCYIGEMLVQESQAVGLTTYSCKWYNLSSRDAKNLQFVICRASVPLQLWAGKFAPLSLELFGSILKTSMSYFSVLLTMKEQLSE